MVLLSTVFFSIELLQIILVVKVTREKSAKLFLVFVAEKLCLFICIRSTSFKIAVPELGLPRTKRLID